MPDPVIPMLLWIVILCAVYARCPVYSFFEVLSDAEMRTGRQDQMLKVWFRNWWANGWDPKILRLEDALGYANFTTHLDHFWTLPTVNRKGYELACYLRWLAFSNVGGGVFVDYDIMNFSIFQIPASFGECGQPADIASTKLASFQKHWPMIMFGGREGADRLIKTLTEYEFNPLEDQFNGKPHTSDMEIVRKKASALIDDGLEAPIGMWHFANSARNGIIKHLTAEEQIQFKKISRSEWISLTLQVDHARRKRTRIWSMNRDQVDSALMDLVKPLALCPNRGDVIDKFVFEASRLAQNEIAKCDFKVIENYETNQSDEYTLLFVEPIHQNLLRKHQNSSMPFEQFYRKPENQNLLLRSFNPQCKSNEQCLNDIKAKIISDEHLILGRLDRLADSKILLEYSLGFTLPAITKPYKPLVNVTPVQIEEIERLNAADQELYAFIVDLWWERLSAVLKVEAQLDRYNDPPAFSLDHYISTK